MPRAFIRFPALAFPIVFPALFLGGCASTPRGADRPLVGLQQVAESSRQWTGVAVDRSGRLFVNFPRWSEDVPISVAEVLPDGTLVPFPDEQWNAWSPAQSPRDRFVCVQSVVGDAGNNLWVLDPASPRFEGVVEGGPKLVRIDIRRRAVAEIFHFGPDIAPRDSYLNDVRIDTGRGFAYITDSGAGALIVVNLSNGTARRVLDDHPSTHSEGVNVIIEGSPWLRPDGSRPEVHADGIAIDARGEFLYYQALTGRTLYRIPTEVLRNFAATDEQIAAGVEALGVTGAADGIRMGPDGFIYLTAIEENAVNRFRPGGSVETYIRDPRLQWPDSLDVGPDGSLYATTSQIHRMPAPSATFKVYRLTTPAIAPEGPRPRGFH